MTDRPQYERFLWNWKDDRYFEKLAIRTPYSERFNDAMADLGRDEAHAQYEPDYEMRDDRPGDDTGAWTMDADQAIINHINQRTEFTIPPLDEMPRSVETRELPPGHLELECPICGADSLLSEREIDRVFPNKSTEMHYCLDVEEVTHMCYSCTTFYEWHAAEGGGGVDQHSHPTPETDPTNPSAYM